MLGSAEKETGTPKGVNCLQLIFLLLFKSTNVFIVTTGLQTSKVGTLACHTLVIIQVIDGKFF